jgi:hypothetical protein
MILFSFGSNEWVERIKKDYLLWPKRDRRLDERRSLLLEQCRRPQKNMTLFLSKLRSNKQNDLLTLEEKQMLSDVLKSD